MSTYPVARIDLAALKHNFQRVKALAPDSKVMSVIKANAYGHGAIACANALVDSDAFATARLSEAVQLRQAGIKQPIVLLEGVHTVAALEQAAEYDLSLVFHHLSQLELLDEAKLAKPLTFCWLMLETGMHRLGFSPADAINAFQRLSDNINISGPLGVMSHFANADTPNDDRNKQQLAEITTFASRYNCPISMANSAGILALRNSHQDWLRPGLMLYGISPFERDSGAELDLKPVMTLCSSIIAIQSLKAGEQVGYGGTWVAENDTQVGIVDIGYGDGYSRQLSNTGTVEVNGQISKVLGRVSMDMIAIDLTSNSDVKIADEVILWGSDKQPVEQSAQQANTIAYELVCQLNQRVLREYFDGES